MTMFSRTLLSTAVLTAITMGSAIAGDDPKVPGFQLNGNSWDLTAGNAMSENTIDIQKNNQASSSLSDIVKNVTQITINTEGRTSAEQLYKPGPFKEGKALTVTGSTGKTNAKLILRSSGNNLSLDKERRRITIELIDSHLKGLVINHGAVLRENGVTQSTQNTNSVTLTKSTIDGDIELADDSTFRSASGQGPMYSENETFSPMDSSKTYYLHYLNSNDNTVNLVQSTWVGNLTSTSEIKGIKNKNTITLDGSNWTGHVADNADDTTINLKNGTVWKVTSADAAAARVVAASNNNRIEKLTSDATSKVVLQKDSKLDVVNATGDLNLHFMSLENTANFDQLEAKTTLIADGSLNDAETP